MSGAGLAAIPARAVSHALRARLRRPVRSRAQANVPDAPARPPAKKYQATSGVHTSCLRICWP